MDSTPISFGTDGWRAVIAQEYTFDNLAKVATALAAYLNKHERELARNGVAIGYDTRFLSAEFAKATADTLAASGLKVLLSNRDSPTPAIAWATRERKLATGIMITASHNAPKFNGFKFFAPSGGPAEKDATNAVEAVLGRKSASKPPAPGSVELFDPQPDFFKQLHRVIDFDLLKSVKGTVVCDAVHGTGRGYVNVLLKECGWKVSTIRQDPDPMFGGVLPDPANPDCYLALQEAVAKKNADLGLANDPDADRFGVVDSTGTYITPNQILSLVYLHLLEHRGIRGPVARSLSTTALLDAIAAKFGQKVIETPVGFKWVGAAIENDGAILGGEESGGLSISGHYPGKDGVLADLLVAEIWALHQQPLIEIYKKVMKRFGTFYSSRIDLRMDETAKTALLGNLKAKPPTEVAGSKVKQVVTIDGVKLKLDDGSWLLLRASGTEPLVRVYLEAPSAKRLKELHKAAQALA